MIQKINDYQIKNLVKYLDKTLLLENAVLKRLPFRINETSVNEIKQRMIEHLKHTFNQKNKLEYIIFEFKVKYEYLGIITTNTPSVSNTNNGKKIVFKLHRGPQILKMKI